MLNLSTTRMRLLPLLLLCLLQACGDSAPAKLDKLAPDATILAFGDSLTFGTGAKPEESYPAVLEQLSGRRVINVGIPGELSAEGMLRLSDVLQKHNPDLVIICHGGNDFLQKKAMSQLHNNLVTMIKIALQSQRMQVVLIGVPKPGLFLKSAEIYEEIAELMGVPLESSVLPAILGDNRLKSDTVHPNQAGYQKMAEAVYALIAERGGF